MIHYLCVRYCFKCWSRKTNKCVPLSLGKREIKLINSLIIKLLKVDPSGLTQVGTVGLKRAGFDPRRLFREDGS